MDRRTLLHRALGLAALVALPESLLPATPTPGPSPEIGPHTHTPTVETDPSDYARLDPRMVSGWPGGWMMVDHEGHVLAKGVLPPGIDLHAGDTLHVSMALTT